MKKEIEGAFSDWGFLCVRGKMIKRKMRFMREKIEVKVQALLKVWTFKASPIIFNENFKSFNIKNILRKSWAFKKLSGSQSGYNETKS